MGPQPAIAIAILHCSDNEVIVVQRRGDEAWDYPGGRIADGEEATQAAARVATLATGVLIEASRFGNLIRDKTGHDGIRRVSYRANLTPDERDALTDHSPCGSRRLLVVYKYELPKFVRDRQRRAMIQAG